MYMRKYDGSYLEYIEMDTEKKNEALGEYIRARRLSRGLSLTTAAENSGLHVSYWSKLESGQYEAPAPKHLMAIAHSLGVDFEDLYGLAGYESPERLPSFTPYLRARYELPPEAVSDLERYFDLLRNYYDIPPDQPVFPPRKPEPNPAPTPKSQGQPRRAA
jgi:transcriptional regulator with XRE-family HTH domain